MATAVVMPRLGWTMETGQVVEWLKSEGEQVEAGELLMMVESDKAINEVEALESGVLRFPPDAPKVGDAVPIGTVLAYLAAPGEVLHESVRLAGTINGNAPLAVRETLRILKEARDRSFEETWRDARRTIRALATTEDYQEGPRAFVEKRPPRWRAR